MPTIRVDQQVWEWLQSHARPFEDTPNSVLRRIARLDAPSAEGKVSVSESPISGHPIEPIRRADLKIGRMSGELYGYQVGLDGQWRYHRDGTFFEVPTQYPAYFTDGRGYIGPYKTRQQLEADHYLRVGKKLNVPGGISRHPHYRIPNK